MSATMTTAPLWTLLELVPALVFLLGVVPWVLLKAIQPRRRLSFDEEALLAKQEYDRYRQSFNYRLQSAGRSGYRFLSTKGMLAKIDRAFNIRAFGKALISTAIIAGMEHTAQNMLPGNVSMNLPGLFQQKSTQNGGNKEIDVAAGLKLTGKDKPKLQKSELWWTTKRLTQWSPTPQGKSTPLPPKSEGVVAGLFGGATGPKQKRRGSKVTVPSLGLVWMDGKSKRNTR